MPVMQIGIMRVAMDEPRMNMGMAMRLARWIVCGMPVAMVSVVDMACSCFKESCTCTWAWCSARWK
jgi:hypothetical protein